MQCLYRLATVSSASLHYQIIIIDACWSKPSLNVVVGQSKADIKCFTDIWVAPSITIRPGN